MQRVLAATSSFFEWAIAAEQYTSDENPMQLRVDHALLAECRTGISHSSAQRAGSSRCAAPCGCDCRYGCRDR